MLTRADIERMSIPERWAAMELLWQSIIKAKANVPSPAWHNEILKERSKSVASGKAKFFSLAEARQKLGLAQK
jgi:hypothetical protein